MSAARRPDPRRARQLPDRVPRAGQDRGTGTAPRDRRRARVGEAVEDQGRSQRGVRGRAAAASRGWRFRISYTTLRARGRATAGSLPSSKATTSQPRRDGASEPARSRKSRRGLRPRPPRLVADLVRQHAINEHQAPHPALPAPAPPPPASSAQFAGRSTHAPPAAGRRCPRAARRSRTPGASLARPARRGSARHRGCRGRWCGFRQQPSSQICSAREPVARIAMVSPSVGRGRGRTGRRSSRHAVRCSRLVERVFGRADYLEQKVHRVSSAFAGAPCG